MKKSLFIILLVSACAWACQANLELRSLLPAEMIDTLPVQDPPPGLGDFSIPKYLTQITDPFLTKKRKGWYRVPDKCVEGMHDLIGRLPDLKGSPAAMALAAQFEVIYLHTFGNFMFSAEAATSEAKWARHVFLYHRPSKRVLDGYFRNRPWVPLSDYLGEMNFTLMDANPAERVWVSPLSLEDFQRMAARVTSFGQMHFILEFEKEDRPSFTLEDWRTQENAR